MGRAEKAKRLGRKAKGVSNERNEPIGAPQAERGGYGESRKSHQDETWSRTGMETWR